MIIGAQGANKSLLQVVVVLDTPTIGHIPVLTSTFTESSFFAKFRSKCQEDISEYAVRVVFHLCGEGVLEDERYKTFMNGFAPDVEVSRTLNPVF